MTKRLLKCGLMALLAAVLPLTMVQPTLASAAGSTGAVNYLTPSAESGCPSTACTQALNNLRSSVNLRVLPSGITPAVLAASQVLQLPQGGQCTKNVSGFGEYQPCQYLTSSTGSTIALIGNSRAWQWSLAVEQIAQRRDARFALAFHSSCFVTATASRLIADGKPGVAATPAECQRWVNAAAAWVVSLKPSTVIVVGDAGNLQGSEEQIYQRGFVSLLRTLQAKGRRLIVLGSQPVHHGDASCLSVHAAAIKGCGVPTSAAVPPAYVRQISDFRGSAATVGARFVNPLPWLCTTTFCPAVIGGTVVQQDPYHLTTAMAEQLAPVLQVAAGL